MKLPNFYATKLRLDIDASATTIDVDQVPRDENNEVITVGIITLEARNPTRREIVMYSGVDGTKLTGCTRGIGGTTASPHSRGAIVEGNLTGQHIQMINDAVNHTGTEVTGDGTDPDFWRALGAGVWYNYDNSITNMPTRYGLATVWTFGADDYMIEYKGAGDNQGILFVTSINASSTTVTWKVGGLPNSYRTTETEIGTWIDGKPIYGRVFTGSITHVAETRRFLELMSNVDSLISVRGWFMASDGSKQYLGGGCRQQRYVLDVSFLLCVSKPG